MNSTKAPAENTSPVFDGQFYKDVIRGLTALPKYLLSKYFYDAEGDILFQHIMNCPEYYLTNCEMEILSGQTRQITDQFLKHLKEFDLVELGAGDATKSLHVLKDLRQQDIDLRYLPIDISGHVIDLLKQTLPRQVPGLEIVGLEGEYFEMLKQAGSLLERNKIVLFLGANIGNMLPDDAAIFLTRLYNNLQDGDLLLLGFDLKKNPRIILDAYNDKAGFTRSFNLNLLKRINRELGADFNLENFEHYATYDPVTGGCKSYLISTNVQKVTVAGYAIPFEKDEYIAMEISQKYTIEEINVMAGAARFKSLATFYDSKHWFADVLLKKG